MRGLSAAEILAVWETGARQHPVDRALTVLAAFSGKSRQELARESVGRRDAGLLDAYRSLFGQELEAFAECPECGERLEYSIPAPVHTDDPQEQHAIEFSEGHLALRMRLPDSTDLSAIRDSRDSAGAGRLLAERCIVEARSGDELFAAPELPDRVIELAGARIAQADPMAEILIDLTCSACRHCWQVLLDIESFLWARVHALAKRLLGEVHVLASAYGWSEADILAMSGARRQLYLEMVS
jgi:hypothetical protein